MAELANDVWALLDELDLTAMAVVGLSMGGLVAMEMAIARPRRVWALGLIATTAQPLTASEWIKCWTFYIGAATTFRRRIDLALPCAGGDTASISAFAEAVACRASALVTSPRTSRATTRTRTRYRCLTGPTHAPDGHLDVVYPDGGSRRPPSREHPKRR